MAYHTIRMHPFHLHCSKTGTTIFSSVAFPRISQPLAWPSGFGSYASPLQLVSIRKLTGVGAEKRRSPRLFIQAKKNSVHAGERILAAAGYFLPLLDGLQYGRFFFLQFPAAEVVIKPLFPLIQVYKSLPFASFVAFFALYLLVVRNPSLSRYVRFNTMQAVVLDVLLILPNLVERTFTPRGGIGFDLLVVFYNTVFLYLVACFVFGTVSCLLGKVPRLPLVADAADAQVM